MSKTPRQDDMDTGGQKRSKQHRSDKNTPSSSLSMDETSFRDKTPPCLPHGTTTPSRLPHDDHLSCVICLGTLKEPYLTRCGHSFCHECIKRHLTSSSSCPTCQATLDQDNIFPNFALSKLLETNSPPNPPSTQLVKQLHESLLSGNVEDWSRKDIDQLLSAILAKRDKIDSTGKMIEMNLLQEFLTNTQRRKEHHLQRLVTELKSLAEDLQHVNKELEDLGPLDSSRKRKLDEDVTLDSSRVVLGGHKERMGPFMEDLEEAYFEWRLDASKNVAPPVDTDAISRFGKRLFTLSRYSKFKTVAHLHYADSFFTTTSSIVSALEFDRDDEFFATAGVTKKIKIYEFGNVLADYKDMTAINPTSIRTGNHHRSSTISALRGIQNNPETDPVPSLYETSDAVPRYPVLEMSSRSKISCLSWNTYFKSQLASCDYEGIVNIWDTSTGNVMHQMEEHEKRTWTVDFSRADPMRLASGSDDAKVKVWSTNQRKSALTIEGKVNVCSVKWNPDLGHQLAFGSADHYVHYYDIRNPSAPLHVFRGHRKAVSYVKFTGRDEFVTASTDSTLKLWNVSESIGQSRSKLLRTFSGHTNEKNFVGLSVNCDGDLIACGSESNEVYIYYPTLTKPIVVHNFGPTLSATNGEAVPDEDPSQFVSSVSWRRHCPTQLIAANSTGRMKILELE